MIPEESQRRRLWCKVARFGVLYHGLEYLIPLEHAKHLVQALADEGYVIFSCSLWRKATRTPGEIVEVPWSHIAKITGSPSQPTADEAARMIIAFLSTATEDVDVSHVSIYVREEEWLAEWFREWMEPFFPADED